MLPSTSEQKKPLIQPKKTPYRPLAVMLGVSVPEALNFASIFTMLHFCADFLFNTPMRFFVFPFAALCGLTKSGSLWHHYHLVRKDSIENEDSKETEETVRIALLQAAWETANSLGTTGAVIAGIVGFFTGAAVAMGISLTFTVLLSASTAICGAYAIYFGITAHRAKQRWNKLEKDAKTKDHLDYKDYINRKAQALENLKWFGIVALLTIGTGVSMVGGFTFPGFIIGTAGCLIAASYSAYNFYKFVKGPQPALSVELQHSLIALCNSSSSRIPPETHKIPENYPKAGDGFIAKITQENKKITLLSPTLSSREAGGEGMQKIGCMV